MESRLTRGMAARSRPRAAQEATLGGSGGAEGRNPPVIWGFSDGMQVTRESPCDCARNGGGYTPQVRISARAWACRAAEPFSAVGRFNFGLTSRPSRRLIPCASAAQEVTLVHLPRRSPCAGGGLSSRRPSVRSSVASSCHDRAVVLCMTSPSCIVLLSPRPVPYYPVLSSPSSLSSSS